MSEKLSVNSRINLFSDVGSWQRTLTFLSRNLSKVAPHLLVPERADLSRREKGFARHELKENPETVVSVFLKQGAFSEPFCGGVAKQQKWTADLGVRVDVLAKVVGRLLFADVGRAQERYKNLKSSGYLWGDCSQTTEVDLLFISFTRRHWQCK